MREIPPVDACLLSRQVKQEACYGHVHKGLDGSSNLDSSCGFANCPPHGNKQQANSSCLMIKPGMFQRVIVRLMFAAHLLVREQIGLELRCFLRRKVAGALVWRCGNLGDALLRQTAFLGLFKESLHLHVL